MRSFTLEAFEQSWQVKVEKHAALGTNNGCFFPNTRTIYIDPNLKHSQQLTVLLHEIIHLIEHYWSFDLGHHPALKDLEIARLIEEGIRDTYEGNKLKLY